MNIICNVTTCTKILWIYFNQHNMFTDSIFKEHAQQIHCLSKKKSCTLNYFVGLPFALITERICRGIVSTTLYNVTTFISIQSF